MYNITLITIQLLQLIINIAVIKVCEMKQVMERKT